MVRKTYLYKTYRLKSKAELEVAKNCEKDKLNWWYEIDKINWEPPPAKTKSYTPDFVIKRKDGSILYVEYKEYLDARSKKVMRYVTKQHPELDIRILFGPKCEHKKISKKSKTTYGQWANKNNIKWAVGRRIPKEWLN